MIKEYENLYLNVLSPTLKMKKSMKTKTNTEQDCILDYSKVKPADLQNGCKDLQIEFEPLTCAQLHSVSETYQSWMQLVENDQNSSLDHHPDHVARLIPILHETHPNFPVYLMQCREEGKLIAAGILLPKSMSTKALKGLGPSRLLQGYYLCGNRFLLEQEYQQTETFLKHLLQSALSFCQKQKAEFLLLEDMLINQILNRSISDSEDEYLIYSHTGFQNRSLIHFSDNPADYWKQFRSKSRLKQKKRLTSKVARCD